MRDQLPSLVFFACCLIWGLLLALLVGACGGSQRRDCAQNRNGDSSQVCMEGRR